MLNRLKTGLSCCSKHWQHHDATNKWFDIWWDRSTHISSRIPLFSWVTLQNQKTFTAGFRLIKSFEYEADARIEVIWPVIQEFQAAQVSHPDQVVHPNQPLLFLPAHACAHIQKQSILTSLWHTHTQKTLNITVKVHLNFLSIGSSPT